MNYLDELEIKYCVVGNIREYPNNIKSDVDIVVEEKKIKQIKTIVQKFSEDEELLLVQCFRHEYNSWRFVLCWVNSVNNFEVIQLDICGNYVRNGSLYIDSIFLLTGRRKKYSINNKDEFFYIPAPEKNLIYYLIKKISKLGINHAEIRFLNEELQKSPSRSKVMIEKYFNKKDAHLILNSIELERFNQLNNSVEYFNRVLQKRRKFIVKNKIQEWFRLLERILKPTGLVIVILGPDGVGKSSLGDGVISGTHGEIFSGAVKRIHLRPYFFNGRNKKNSVTSKSELDVDIYPYANKDRSFIVSMAKLMYFLLDYVVGYWLLVRPIVVRSGFVVFDRYYYDLFLDPRRYRYGGSILFAKLMSCLIPEPDLILVLDAPALEIHQRKQEVSIDETEQQRNAYTDFAKKNKLCVLLNASKPLITVVGDAKNVLFLLLSKRLKSENFNKNSHN